LQRGFNPREADRFPQWFLAAFVPGYSGGTATDLHRFPYSSTAATSGGGHPSRDPR
jgi:hypothetical protein